MRDEEPRGIVHFPSCQSSIQPIPANFSTFHPMIEKSSHPNRTTWVGGYRTGQQADPWHIRPIIQLIPPTRPAANQRSLTNPSGPSVPPVSYLSRSPVMERIRSSAISSKFGRGSPNFMRYKVCSTALWPVKPGDL